MTVKPVVAGAFLLAAALGGCASLGQNLGQPGDPVRPAEVISYSVGPCFGFCPVYQVKVLPDGEVTFTGERHTAVLGEQRRGGKPSAYAATAKALAAYRPATGETSETQCEQRISDLQHYRIVWTSPEGVETVLMHDKGCRSPKNDALNKVLEDLPGTLGIADWAKGEVRPGASRG
ncbi:MAG: DUF6438 domain-containing protein [Asticcacaulis sp.]